MKVIILLVIGYLIGRVHSYYKNRTQCTNCGKHNTSLVSSVYGSTDGICDFAVKHSEQYICNDCGKTTHKRITLVK